MASASKRKVTQVADAQVTFQCDFQVTLADAGDMEEHKETQVADGCDKEGHNDETKILLTPYSGEPRPRPASKS